MKKIFSLIILLGLVTAGFYISDVQTGVYEPGTSGTFSFVLGSSETTEVSGINVEITYPKGVSGRETFYIGSLTPGSSTYISVPFKVNSDAKSGSYPVEIKATGSVKDNNDYYYIERSSFATLQILDKPVVSVVSSSNEVGKTTKITLTPIIEKGQAYDIVVSAKEPFSLVPESVLLNEPKEVTLDARNVPDGPTTLVLKVSYKDVLGNEYFKDISIPVTVKKDLSSIVISAEGMVQGKEVPSTITVENKGKPIENLKLTFSEGLKLKTNEVLIGDLATGETKSVSTSIFTELEPGINYIPVHAEWIEDGERKEDSLTIAADVSPNNNIKVYIEAKPVPLEIGKDAKLNIVVANSGNSKVSGVSVKIEGIDLLSVSNEQFIGELAKDDFSSVQFDIMAGAKENNLKVIVDYIDSTGNKQKEIYTYKILAKEPKQDNTIYLVAGGAVILVGGYLVYKRFKKKK